MTAVEDWAERIVEAMAFRHVAASSACTGFCIVSSGRVACYRCAWQLSGSMDDVGERRSALFAYAALATIGAAVEAATMGQTFAATIEASSEGEALQTALAKLREQFPTAEIEEVTIRFVPGEDEVS